VCRLCARIRARSIFRHVVPAYLDEPALVAPTVARLDHRHIIIVPFLLSESWHTRQTIPDALQLAGDRTEREGSVLWYARS
jgi:sirohydrochlorin cobaltochelatase